MAPGPADESLVGSSNIQSPVDLTSSFEVVKGVQLAPITKDALMRVGSATLAMGVPLALSRMSLEELVEQLIGFVFYRGAISCSRASVLTVS
jgi:hypothetical protein